MSKQTSSRPAREPYKAGPNGHGYCWETHPTSGVHCNHPIGHKKDGVPHQYPYVRPPIRWS
ncbi:hypothetical protein [Streptomyces stelliscabiei]|uniref:Uncharacterized protein n=1 Tax=Streptomyces stelliscabiei TaxID=146820 RepID=A0A8I0P618_9ACTN|nr:hypothetical protein [Streptomyces stelliscabiei]KND30261.1 hypothetical protein IQ64_41300 [Streptomyces stelliscabiei]MBE1598930.1 hypothetical protein [Streptomyces stelliscabiei]